MSDQNPERNGGHRPVPDPTVLTTAALVREISALQQLMETKIEAEASTQEQRYFAVAKQLEFLEQQRKEQKADTAAAVAQALAAQQNSVSKSEQSMMKQLEQLSNTLKSVEDGLRRDNDALKDRIGAAETRVTSVEAQKVGAKEDRSGLYAAAGIGISILFAVMGVIAFFAARGGP